MVYNKFLKRIISLMIFLAMILVEMPFVNVKNAYAEVGDPVFDEFAGIILEYIEDDNYLYNYQVELDDASISLNEFNNIANNKVSDYEMYGALGGTSWGFRKRSNRNETRDAEVIKFSCNS